MLAAGNTGDNVGSDADPVGGVGSAGVEGRVGLDEGAMVVVGIDDVGCAVVGQAVLGANVVGLEVVGTEVIGALVLNVGELVVVGKLDGETVGTAEHIRRAR